MECTIHTGLDGLWARSSRNVCGFYGLIKLRGFFWCFEFFFKAKQTIEHNHVKVIGICEIHNVALEIKKIPAWALLVVPWKKLFQSSQSQGRKLLRLFNVPRNLDIFAECLLQILFMFLTNFLGDQKNSPFCHFSANIGELLKCTIIIFSPLDLICPIIPFYACDVLFLPCLITVVDFSGSFRDQYLWVPKIAQSQIKH